MSGRRQLSRALLLGAGLFASFAGCLVVSPLEDDFPEATSGRGGTSMHAGSSSAAGEGGEMAAGGTAPSSDKCETNTDCVRPGAGAAYRCRPSDRTCVRLSSDECPLVYGHAEDPNAVYFGAFATMNPVAPDENTILWAHQLALGELSGDDLGGLPDGPGGKARPLVMIACNNAEGQVEPALKHLVEQAEVPAVIATLKPGDLRRGYEAHQPRKIFYLSPVAVTKTLAGEKDDDLIWNMLGQPGDLAPAYAELTRLSEAYLRDSGAVEEGSGGEGGQGSGEPQVRVALVTTPDAFDSELANSVRAVLKFNGEDLATNTAALNYEDYTIDADDDLAQVAIEVVTFRPHIIVSAASELFTMPGGLLQQVEDAWEENTIPGFAMRRPFYLLSPYNAGDLGNVENLINGSIDSGFEPNAHQRFIGLSIAGAEDLTLQNGYGNRLRSTFEFAYTDSANYYDAVYFLAYAMYGSSDAGQLTGPGIADGMQRLLSGQKSFDIDPLIINDVFDELALEGATIHLNSTLGPPDFDPMTGVRSVEGGVFCFKKMGSTALRQNDVLRYDTELGAYRGQSFPCFSGFFP